MGRPLTDSSSVHSVLVVFKPNRTEALNTERGSVSPPALSLRRMEIMRTESFNSGIKNTKTGDAKLLNYATNKLVPMELFTFTWKLFGEPLVLHCGT